VPTLAVGDIVEVAFVGAPLGFYLAKKHWPGNIGLQMIHSAPSISSVRSRTLSSAKDRCRL
jgi:hypothetical protein